MHDRHQCIVHAPVQVTDQSMLQELGQSGRLQQSQPRAVAGPRKLEKQRDGRRRQCVPASCGHSPAHHPAACRLCLSDAPNCIGKVPGAVRQGCIKQGCMTYSLSAVNNEGRPTWLLMRMQVNICLHTRWKLNMEGLCCKLQLESRVEKILPYHCELNAFH